MTYSSREFMSSTAVRIADGRTSHHYWGVDRVIGSHTLYVNLTAHQYRSPSADDDPFVFIIHIVVDR